MSVSIPSPAVSVAPAFAQAKQPQPKTKQEVEALMAIQNATDVNARLAAIDEPERALFEKVFDRDMELTTHPSLG